MIKTISDKNERVLSAVIIIVLLGYLAVFGIINFAGFVGFCTPDMYEDTLVARLMWEQKTLFPENYVFGNQFYVVATPALSALFYGLTGSMNTSMELATTVMSLLILVSLDWLLRPFVRKRLIRLCSLLMVVAVVSVPDAVRQDEGQLFFIMASFYACYTISYFVIMGDYIRAFGDGRLRPVPFVLSLFLCFCTGMQSLRQTCISILPILAFELCAAVYRKIRTGRFYSRGQYMTLIRAAAYAAANLCGLVLIRALDVCQQTIYLHGGASADAVTSGTLRTIIDAMRCVTGFDYAQGFGGFFIVTFIFNTGTVLYAAVLVLRALKKGRGSYMLDDNRHKHRRGNSGCCSVACIPAPYLCLHVLLSGRLFSCNHTGEVQRKGTHRTYPALCRHRFMQHLFHLLGQCAHLPAGRADRSAENMRIRRGERL